jgi:hypothetical protein
MKTNKVLAILIGATVIATTAQARDDLLRFPIKDAMETGDAKEKLDSDIRFYFGAQRHPKPLRNFGTFTANKKTNFFNKSDKEGCERAFLSAMITFQDRARREGGNAVVGVKSYYRKNEFSSETEYECGAGNVVGGVTMRGDVVKLP